MRANIEELKRIAELEMLKIKALGPYIIEPLEEDDGEDQHEISPAGIRMARKRKRENNARLFWEIRLRTGRKMFTLIDSCTPKVIEEQRGKVIKKMAEWVKAYPDRAEKLSVTESKA